MTAHTASVLVTASELASAGPVVVLDVRAPMAHAAGHWPGAISLDIAHWERLARSPEGGLEHRAVWARQIGDLGIDGSRPVAVHDDGRMTDAARAWFILQWHGVDARVVDGGWPALECELAGGAQPGLTRPDPRNYLPPDGHVPRVGLVDRHALRDQLAAGAVQVLDARTATEYAGVDRRANARGGHLPRARLLPHGQLLAAGGGLRPVEDLRAQLEAAGLEAQRPVVTHCDAGGRAALAALAAVQAGHPQVHTYYLSFSDWAADASCPVVTPDPSSGAG